MVDTKQTNADAGRRHHLIGFVANSAERVPCLLHRHQQTPWLQPLDAITQYCVGHYAAGDVMISTRPVRSSRTLSPDALLLGQSSPWLIGDACHAGGPAQLFRFRRWLMAVGDMVELSSVVRSELLEALPMFVRRLLAGRCDAELLFLRLMASLHAEALLVASTRYSDLVDHLRMAMGAVSPVDVIACNGQAMFCAGSGLMYCRLEGLEACELCGMSNTSAHRGLSYASHRGFKAVCVASRPLSFGERWVEIPRGQVLVVDHSLHVHHFDAPRPIAAASLRETGLLDVAS